MVQGAWVELIDFSSSPWMNGLEGCITKQDQCGFWVKFDRDQLMSIRQKQYCQSLEQPYLGVFSKTHLRVIEVSKAHIFQNIFARISFIFNVKFKDFEFETYMIFKSAILNYRYDILFDAT